MPKKAKELSALAVSKLSKQGRYAVGGADGLHLCIDGNSKAWVLRIKIGERRTDLGLGAYPDPVSLADARDAARELRRKVRDGIDPVAAKREARVASRAERVKAKSFEDCAVVVVEKKSHELKSAKHLAQWTSTLTTYAYPVIGAKAVGTITKADVLAVLEPIWRTKNETADRVRGRIETVLDYAKAMGYREGDNPASWKGNLEPILGKVNRDVKHHASLPYVELGAFMVELRKREGISARALEFSILTAGRSGEVREATWGEFDLDAALWVIPAARMKKGREHHVPLSPAAVALLRALPRVVRPEGAPDYVFAAPRGGALSDMALTAVLKRMGRADLTQHGFRSTFREWAGERSGYPREVAEHALAHSLADKAEAAYQRGTLFPKRIQMMNAWTDFCAMPQKVPANVVPLNASVAA